MANLKKPSSNGKLTPQQEKEYIKCAGDCFYFINNYCRIIAGNQGIKPLALFDYQTQLLQDLLDYRFNVILKARQLGITTVAAAYCLWICMFQGFKDIGAVADKEPTILEMMRRFKMMYEYLPDWLKAFVPTTRSNETTVEFATGSRITCTTTTDKSLAGRTLYLLVMDEAALIDIAEDLWTVAYPTLACLAGDTRVLTPNGFQQIKDFHENRNVGDYFPIDGLEVWGKNGLESVSHGYVSPENETLKIKTKMGREVEATPSHPLYKLCSTGGEMVKAKDLNLGDPLRVDFGMNIFGNNQDINEELAYMLGGYISEGWITKDRGKYQTIWISNSDDDFREKYLKNTFVKKFTPYKNPCIKMFCCSQELIKLFMDCGIDPQRKCDTKIIPEKIWSCSKSVVASFLRGMFDGDGSVTTRAIFLSSTSLKLLQETQLMLLNFGIHSIIAKVDAEKVMARERKSGRLLPQGKPVGALKDSWNLTIPRGFFEKFSIEIGFDITRKREKLQLLMKEYVQDQGKTFRIPLKEIRKTVQNIIFKTGKSGRWFRQHGIRLDRISHVDAWIQPTAKKFKNIISEEQLPIDEKDLKFLTEITQECFWDEIISIEKSQNITYDFTVSKTHSFLQNGIMGSNTGGRAMVMSSPRGVSTWFYDIYTKSEMGENDFKATKLMWYVRPDYTQEWFEKTTRNLTPRKIAQEFCCDFLGSSETVIDSDTIDKLEKRVIEPISKEGPGKALWIWEEAKKRNQYLLTCDTARGDSTDYTAAHVIDLGSLHQVAEYKCKIPIDEAAVFLYELGRRYNNALLVVENNTLGYMAANTLQRMNYPNLHYSRRNAPLYEDPVDAAYYDPEQIIPGFHTTQQNRPAIVTQMELYLRRGTLKIFSSRLIQELKTFIYNNGKPEHAKGMNDDLVMSLCIGCWLIETIYGGGLGGLANDPDGYKYSSPITQTTSVLNTIISGQTDLIYNTKSPTAYTDYYSDKLWALDDATRKMVLEKIKEEKESEYELPIFFG